MPIKVECPNPKCKESLHILGVLAVCLLALASGLPQAVAQDEARRVLDAAGVKGGLIVHLGCGDGKLTAALRPSEYSIVQGLDADAANVKKARKHIQSLGLYGKVSIDQLRGNHLPYADNLINLLVVSGKCNVPKGEMLRVLAPDGVALFLNRKSEIGNRKLVKPRPADIDEWTHYLHDSSNNAVAQDSVVDSPYHVQWVGAPKYARSHQFLTSVTAMVSAGGRLFYVADEGYRPLHNFLPAKWSLCARDAFNGVLLWKRPIPSWQPFSQHGRIPFPPDLHRRLVAVGDRVYTTLDIFAPVSALDAATGKTLHTYEETERAEEVVCCGDVLYCVIGLTDPKEIDRRTLADRREKPERKRLMALQANTGKVLWTKEDEDMDAFFNLTLAVQGGKLVFANANEIVCLDAATGAVRWRYPRSTQYARSAWSTPTLVIYDDVVLCADRLASAPDVPKTKVVNAELVALSGASGEKLWSVPCAEGVREPVDVFVIKGAVWVGERPSRKSADFRTGYDLHTGEVRKKFESTEGWATWHHHRCYREKATTRYILAGRTGVEFIDLKTGEITPHQWIRGICRYGVLPCNGLLYLPPDPCACYIQSRLCGFHALASKGQSPEVRDQRPDIRLHPGPAYGQTQNTQSTIRNPQSDDWPTFRHDNTRSGFSPSEVPTNPEPVWETSVGGKLTTLVSAEGKVFVCRSEAHEVVCLDMESGKDVWRFTAGGRVDSPPTIAGGIAVFGSRDGYVYALRASDGALIWRFRAAPDDRRIVAYDQVESVWPVHGSTLVENGAVYVAAGRSSYLDGGVFLAKLDLATGKPLLTKCHYSRDPKTGRRVELFAPLRGEMQPEQDMPGLLPGVFSADQDFLYLRSVALTRDLDIVGLGNPHLFCSMGLLDDASWERTYWLFGPHMYSGCIGWQYARTLDPAGRIITFDDTRAYFYRDATYRPGLYASAKVPERLPPPPNKKGKPKTRAERLKRRRARWSRMKFAYDWQSNMPLNVRAMVLAKDRIFVAGTPRFNEKKTYAALGSLRTDDAELPPVVADAVAAFEGRKGVFLWAICKTDGKKLAEQKLDSMPVFDGMIAGGGRLYLSTVDGKVMCLGSKQR
ncbi:MAG: PQQ-binding-like beta-propeller repeat protein [Planctomycetes bacterium]|nr:PQQ-binding-like beta-propeller repeat protein [Planctomycetota bacterium]